MIKKMLMLFSILLLSTSVAAQEVPASKTQPVVKPVTTKTVETAKPVVKSDTKPATGNTIKVDTKANAPVNKTIPTKKTLVPPATLEKPVPAKTEKFGGLEIYGHINTGLGYNHLNSQPAASLGDYFAQEGMKSLRTDLANHNNFMFYVGDIMLGVNKSFGNIAKMKAELVFGRTDSFSPNDFSLGQAYASFNIKDAEILVGHFIAPMGYESPYINENDLPMHSLANTFLLPSFLTGVKGYYKFNDMVDLQIWAANNLRDTFVMKNIIPAFGTKVGLTAGKFDVNIAGAVSPEVNVGKYGKMTYIADLNTIYSVTKNLTLSAEGVYRYDSAPSGTSANKYYLGSGKANYKFSDKWDGTLEYSFLKDVNGLNGNASINATPAAPIHIWGVGTSATGIQGNMHQVAAGGQYYITDGAKIQGLYRFDAVCPNGADCGFDHTVVGNFAYSF